MKKQKSIVLYCIVLAVSILMLFTGCNQYYQKKLTGVWEVDKVEAKLPIGPNGKMQDVAYSFPLTVESIIYKPFTYFTSEGKCNIGASISGGLLNGVYKTPFDDFNYRVDKNNLIISGEVTVENEKIVITANMEFTLKGKELNLIGKIIVKTADEAPIEVTEKIVLKKVSSPTLDEAKKAKKISELGFLGIM